MEIHSYLWRAKVGQAYEYSINVKGRKDPLLFLQYLT